MSTNVIPIPITYNQRKLNEYGEGYVPCLVSERWLQFPETAVHEINIPVKIMEQSGDGEATEVGELFISKSDLLRAINAVKIEDE